MLGTVANLATLAILVLLAVLLYQKTFGNKRTAL